MASLKVAVRVRPFNNREIEMDAKLIVQMDGKKTRLLKPKQNTIDNNSMSASVLRENYNDFTFDYSYWSFERELSGQHVVTQDEVYRDLGIDVINCAFEGYNACVFAYGQTGSGKTFTMMGSADEQGLIPRICKEMFDRMKFGQQSGTGYKTNVSYLEIYNERVKDLLGNNSSSAGHALKVREHRIYGPYVEDLSLHPVMNYEEIKDCIDRGNMLRTTASTNMNDTSSRSHAIITITFVQAVFMDEMPSETVSKIHLVDLAGSERAYATGATGDRLKEGAHINKSLVTLGSVISALAEQSTQSLNQQGSNRKKAYIPYRDSVLTWLLKDSLGGNSKTIMIAAISPADCNYGETLSTLRYANRAKNIINKPTINEDPNVKLIRELRDEIMKLKSLLSSGDITNETLHIHSSQMLEDLLKKEAQEKILTEEWAEKWRQAQSILREEKALGLRKSGVGVVLDSEAPHLIGIHDDNSTGVTLYCLKEGETTIGYGVVDDESGRTNVDIVLHGPGILSLHCSIQLTNGTAVIHPRIDAQCWLNANLIIEPMTISQGDIILLGRTNMFRYNNPMEAAKLRKDENRCRSRRDLSRLSLIAASRENLSGNMQCYNEEELPQNLMAVSMRKEKFLGTNEQYEEMQEEHRKILETIENALYKLNSKCAHISEQHEYKVHQLTEKLTQLENDEADKLAIVDSGEDLLKAKHEMLSWNKANKKYQVDIAVKQISMLQIQHDSKNAELQEWTLKVLNELEMQGKLEELNLDKEENNTEKLFSILLTVSELLMDSESDRTTGKKVHNLVTRKREDIKHIDIALNEKEKILKNTIKEMAELDEAILLIDEELRQLLLMRSETFTSNSQNPTMNNHLVASWDNESDIEKEASAAMSTVISASTKKMCQKPQTHSTICSMRILRQNMAAQKAQIMKNLELNNCKKHELDLDICKLQNMQKQYILYEKDMAYNDETPNRTDFCLSSDEGDVSSEDFLRGIHGDANSNSGESRDDKGKVSAIGSDENVMSHGQSTTYRSHSLLSQYQLDSNSESEYAISIPSYLIRGAGKQTHFEYEVRITLRDDKWILLRRFSRFRELHLTMKNIYGEKIATIPFPRREFFSSNSESVARNRRRQLETYLRRLLVVCSKIPQCPFYEGPNGYGLRKSTLVEFSQFFRKGIFESGKYGTG